MPLIGLLAMAFFFAIVGWSGLRYVAEAFASGETSQGMRLPIWTLRLAVPIGALLVVARCVEGMAGVIGRRQP